MPKHQPAIFVFWGRAFDEIAATIFVGKLRQAGLWVKLVGLDGDRSPGKHGVVLVPDLTLSQALAKGKWAICVIFPCCAAQIYNLADDPRLANFCLQAQASGAAFVIGEPWLVDDGKLPWLDQAAIYSPHEDLVSFIQTLPAILPNKSNAEKGQRLHSYE